MNSHHPARLTVTRSICPLCRKELLTHWYPAEIPFFGEVLHITSQCECGFRCSDTLILTQRKPVRYELKVKNPGDLDARVVRSLSGTIHIPELGVDIEPGPASESFVSNIEGVLDRVTDILEMVMQWGEKEKTERAKDLISTIDKVKAGECEVTIILEDPMGNSAIISQHATSRELSDEEASHLKTGMVVLEKSDIEEQPEQE